MAASKRRTGGARDRGSLTGTRTGVRTRSYDEFVRGQVAELQRARILTGMVEECCERGVGSVSVAHVVSRSGVSRRTFYEVFVDREDCFLAAFERALGLARERVLDACEGQGSWRERVRVGLIAFLGLLEDEPRLGRVLVCESAAGGSRVLARRSEAIELIARAVDEGRGESKAGMELSPLTAEGIVGGALGVIQARLLAQSTDAAHEQVHAGRLYELASPLMSMIVLPYLGPATARRELARTVLHDAPRALNGSSPAMEGMLLADPFKAAGMRLTYRTVRVLSAIDAHPDASNRQVGESAGIADQGQISKLLGRLERIGLISNTGLGPGQGAPNSWALTPSGQRVVSTIRSHTESPHSGGSEG